MYVNSHLSSLMVPGFKDLCSIIGSPSMIFKTHPIHLLETSCCNFEKLGLQCNHKNVFLKRGECCVEMGRLLWVRKPFVKLFEFERVFGAKSPASWCCGLGWNLTITALWELSMRLHGCLGLGLLFAFARGHAVKRSELPVLKIK